MSQVTASAVGKSRSLCTASQNLPLQVSPSLVRTWCPEPLPVMLRHTQIRFRNPVSAFSAARSDVNVKFIRCR